MVRSRPGASFVQFGARAVVVERLVGVPRDIQARSLA